MAKAKGKGKQKVNGGGKKKSRPAVRTSRAISSVPRTILSDKSVLAWRELLRDPCSGNLAHPCYAGMDNGYLVRTVDIFQPTYLGTFTSGSSYKADGYYAFTPSQYTLSNGIIGGAAAASATLTLVTQGETNFITNQLLVARFRPVAGCVKWIPSGTYSLRSGLVGMGYSPGVPVVASSSTTGATMMAQQNRVVTSGAAVHEARWLPTLDDERFVTTGTYSVQNAGGGTVTVALVNIDSTAQTTTSATMNGYFEATWIWEWVPTYTQGVTLAPTTPAPYTSQQVLSTIKDLGGFMYDGALALGAAYRSPAGQAAMGVVTAGIRQAVTRAPGMMLLA